MTSRIFKPLFRVSRTYIVTSGVAFLPNLVPLVFAFAIPSSCLSARMDLSNFATKESIFSGAILAEVEGSTL